MKLISLLIVCLFFLVACDTEEAPTPEVTKKSYYVNIGTWASANQTTLRYNPAGAVFLKAANGTTELYKYGKIKVAISGEYVVESPSGNFIQAFDQEQEATTDNEGDIFMNLYTATIKKDQKIVKVKKLLVTMVVIKEGIVYKKTFNFNNDSIWDLAVGLGTALIDLKITKMSEGNWYDIDADLILVAEGSPNAKSAKPKTLAKVFDGSRSSGKDVPEKKTVLKSKPFRAKAQ